MFAGFETVVNMIAIISGGILGIIGGRFLTDRIQETLRLSCGIAVIFIGAGGTLSKMLDPETLQTSGELMMILSLAVGGLIGEVIDIDGKVERFENFLKQKTGNENDSKFIDGFVTASITVCIGAMAVIGAIEDRLFGNYSILYAKSILDFLIIMALSASLGKGCIFSSIPVGIFQGSITILAGFIEPIMTDSAVKNLSYVGNILIFCVGLNLVFGNKIRVANLLLSIVIAMLWK